jgi:hypothetical protein
MKFLETIKKMRREALAPRPAEGYVYFITTNQEGFPIKIGHTDQDVHERIQNLQTGNPYKIEVLCVVAGSVDDEHVLHFLFEEYRLVGEWFDVNDKLTELIQGLKGDLLLQEYIQENL